MENKMKKRLSIAIVGVIVLIIGVLVFVQVKNGILVSPTDKSLAKLEEVPEYDVLQWQFQREQEILNDYKMGNHSFSNPYVIVDPYSMNPGSALVIYEGEKAGEIEVTIQGDDEYATYRYTKSSPSTHFEIPIIGLYVGRENVVSLKDQDGNTTEIKIQTEPLPLDFQTFKLEKSVPEKMEPGTTLFISCFEQSYTALVDHNADVRGYLSNRYMAHGTSIIQLSNGNLLSTGDEYKQIPYNMTSLWEFNWLGKVFREYEIPNGVHHGIRELPNGDLLLVSNNKDMFNSGTREDVAVIVDRKSGIVKKEYDFRKILDEKRDPYTHFHPPVVNATNIDWMHMNAAIYDQLDNLLIVSSPIQSQVVAINPETDEIQWILGPHDGYEGTSEFLKQYLLTPIGDNFEWQWGQHDPELLPDFDNNAGTIDLLLYDNGQNRGFTKENSLDPENNYSRAVHYRIDPKKKTVEQIWQYGKDCGSSCYATFLGDADYLPITGNRLITFGGQLRSNGVPTDNIISGVLGDTITNSLVREVSENGDLAFSVLVKENKYTNSAETYQAERINQFSPHSFDYRLGEIKGERLGISYINEQTDLISPPLFFGGEIQTNFNRIVLENGRLIADGTINYKGKTYLLARAIFILRSMEKTYIYTSTSGLNGRFFLSLDTHQLEKGTYQISIAGAVVEGNDPLKGKMFKGHILTPYKLTVK
jgi:arylsulfate sulfotransferase